MMHCSKVLEHSGTVESPITIPDTTLVSPNSAEDDKESSAPDNDDNVNDDDAPNDPSTQEMDSSSTHEIPRQSSSATELHGHFHQGEMCTSPSSYSSASLKNEVVVEGEQAGLPPAAPAPAPIEPEYHPTHHQPRRYTTLSSLDL